MYKLVKTPELHGRISFGVIWSGNVPKRLLDKFFCRNCRDIIEEVWMSSGKDPNKPVRWVLHIYDPPVICSHRFRGIV
jgi:hypothetical protein